MKNILVTGASRGIGHETARILAALGHRVVATARTIHALKKLEGKFPGSVTALPADLTKPEDIERIAVYLRREELVLDGLIQNAGLLIHKPFEELNDSDWNSLLEVNVMGPVRLTRTLLPLLGTGSHLLHISSMGGYMGSKKFPGLAGYSTAKGALVILAECLSAELADRKIHANALCLGAVQTGMFDEAFPGLKAPVTADEMGNYIAEFVLNGHQYYNGKVLPVALADPD